MTDPAGDVVKGESSSVVSRRDALRAVAASGLLMAGGTAAPGQAPAQAQTSAKSPAAVPATRPAAGKLGDATAQIAPLNRFPRMVQEYFVRQVRQVERAADVVRERIKTRADAERYIADVRARIAEAFGPLPEKTPLNARVTGVVERDAYHIEKVLFDSRPGFPVTANLYVPKNRRGQMPGVVGSCGHSVNGKAAEAYQSFAQGLARLGYVVLIFDPVGQGERLQYTTDDLKPRFGIGVSEHLLAGNQQFLVGEFLGSWRAWDGIRALDYLLTRPEVDPKHVGITGNSGGGTMTTWLCGLDNRWTMGAASCFVTTFRRNMENELPADTEQCPPRALALGLDHSDFLAAMAPRPVILMAQEKDYFDARGTAEAYTRLKHLYTLLGAPDNVALHVGPQHHGYSIENRTAMYRWFNRATGVAPADTDEPTLTIEKDATLYCTPVGQVAGLGAISTIPAHTRAKSQSLAKDRKPLSGEALAGAVCDALRLPAGGDQPPPLGPDYRILRPAAGRRYPMRYAGAYAVETEPDVHALVYRLSAEPLHSRVPRGAARAVLYVSHHSADAELRDEPLIAEIMKAEPESAVYACDVRGIGESQPNTCGTNTFLTPYGCDYFYAVHSIMLDRPYVGQKALDVLRVLEWLRVAGEHREVHLVAKGWGALPATFAAIARPKLVTQVTLKNALTSYSAIAESDGYKWPLSSFVPGVLYRFDLPDCYRELEATRKLRQIDPWGPQGG